MDNPYVAPNSAVSSAATSPKKLTLVFWLGAGFVTILSILVGVIGGVVIPSFMELYDGFGTSLPASTQLVIDARHYLWSASLVAMMIWAAVWRAGFISNARTRMLSYGLLLLGIIDGALIVGVFSALYEPLYALSEAI